MGAQGLQARLTTRLLGLMAMVVVAMGGAAVAVADRLLETSDSDVARAHALDALDSLHVELGEGDSFAKAASEVTMATQRDGARLRLEHGEQTFGDPLLGAVPSSACLTLDVSGDPWRACGARGDQDRAVAAVPIGAHRAAIAALWRGMGAVVVAAMLLVWLAIRQALRRPLAEIDAVVSWTGRILDASVPETPPPAEIREVAQLEAAFDALVRKLLDGLARERASSAHIAHELRTPLTAIVAELSAVKPLDDASKGAIARARSDVARLADVIDAILVLSEGPRSRGRRDDRRDSASRPDWRAPGIVNLADLARELAPAGTQVLAPDEALVEADEHLVRLALRNLLDNARKYAGGARQVRVSNGEGGARLSVIDEGPGVEAPARERMFDRYWRGSADGEGRGLGLALVRAVAERHGGTAQAASREGSRGLEVSLTLGHVLEWREERA
ncbi:MAG TPA: HAMP domain-containing sensor histidine kinase [Polyangiaceae bacterium]|jgi:signal transduction histidine kinase